MTEFELSRRDAIAALATGGIATSSLGVLAWNELGSDDADGESFSSQERATLEALAFTLYPTEVTGVREFVETYVVGKVSDRPERAAGIRDAIAELDAFCRAWEDEPFADLSPDRQDEILREFGVHVSDPDPDGAPEERVRYYLVNELQYALYTSPTGGELVGTENPQGFPGGTASYQRPPLEINRE